MFGITNRRPGSLAIRQNGFLDRREIGKAKEFLGIILSTNSAVFHGAYFFPSAQRSRHILGVLYNSFDKSLTFDFSHATLYHKSDHFTYIKPVFDFIFRPAATPNHFAAIHLRQNPLALARRIFYFSERLAAAGRSPACNSLTRTLTTASAVRIGYRAMTPPKCGRA